MRISLRRQLVGSGDVRELGGLSKLSLGFFSLREPPLEIPETGRLGSFAGTSWCRLRQAFRLRTGVDWWRNRDLRTRRYALLLQFFLLYELARLV